MSALKGRSGSTTMQSWAPLGRSGKEILAKAKIYACSRALWGTRDVFPPAQCSTARTASRAHGPSSARAQITFPRVPKITTVCTKKTSRKPMTISMFLLAKVSIGFRLCTKSWKKASMYRISISFFELVDAHPEPVREDGNGLPLFDVRIHQEMVDEASAFCNWRTL